MSYKNLTTDEMLQLSAGWIEPKSKAHKAILATPDLAPALPRVTAVHRALSALAQPATDNPRLAKISAEELIVDGRHDAIIRGAHALLTGIALLLGDEGDGHAFEALRDALIPDGLPSTQKTYRAESGQAAQLAERLTPAERARLASILVGPKNAKHTLEDYIDEWIAHGATLGRLEDEKAHLQPGPGEPGGGTGSALVAARNKWIRVVNALVANGEAAELDAETDALIFGPLRHAEKNTARRSHRGAAEAAPGSDASSTTATPPK